jgi:hypothetical protein
MVTIVNDFLSPTNRPLIRGKKTTYCTSLFRLHYAAPIALYIHVVICTCICSVHVE